MVLRGAKVGARGVVDICADASRGGGGTFLAVGYTNTEFTGAGVKNDDGRRNGLDDLF